MIETVVGRVEASAGAVADDEFFEPHHDAYTDHLSVPNRHELVELAE